MVLAFDRDDNGNLVQSDQRAPDHQTKLIRIDWSPSRPDRPNDGGTIQVVHQNGSGTDYNEAYKRGVEASMKLRHSHSAAAPKEDHVKAEVLKLGSRLADLISHAPVNGNITPEMRSLAASISSALGGKSSESRLGRAFAKDLVPGGLYVGKGWASGDFEWIYVGPVPGDPARITIRKEGSSDPSVELLGDHGLAPYDEAQQGNFWHPTNWTEGTGVGESTGRMVADAAGRDIDNIGTTLGDDDEF